MLGLIDYSSLFAQVSVVIPVYLLFLFIYRTSFDKLSHIPGPKLAASTHFYWHYYTITGQRASKAFELHQRYGEVVRLTPKEVSFINEQAWKDIYAHRQGRGQLEKADRRPFDVRGKETWHIINAPDEVHARQRKMVAHAFSDRALREQEPLLKTYVDLMIKNLHEDAHTGKPIDIIKSYNHTTFDFIGDFAFAEPFDNLRTRIDHPFMLLIFSSVRISTIITTLVAAFPILRPCFGYMRRFAQVFDFGAFVHEKVESRINDGDRNRPDLMTSILRHNSEDGTGITRREIEATATILIGAGSETTATLLSGCTYLLLRNLDKLEKLKREIREAFDTADDITVVKLNALPYLLAVLEESLRLYPPVPIGLPRIIPPEGMAVCGIFLPGNTRAGVAQYTAYRSSSNFADPMEFIPERHLSDRPLRYDTDKRGVLQPFSMGPRNCVGRNLAYTEMKLMIARVLYDFDLSLADPDQKWNEQKVWTLWDKPPLMVNLTERD